MTAKKITPEEFKGTSIEPGSKERYLVKVGEMSTGSEVELPVIVANGSRDGPCVFITAGMHAEEAACIDAVMRFSSQVDPNEISGKLVMVPLQNAPAWAHRSRLYPFDAPSLLDLIDLKTADDEGAMTSRVLHMICDLTIAAENARFGQTGPRVGSFDGGYGASYMARIVGQKKAREIWFLCRQYDASQALAMGLVNEVVALEDLEATGVEWALEILQNSPMAIRCLKAALNADCDGQAGLQELAGNATMLFYMSEEGQEGHSAYLEKRAPDFSKYPWRP